MTTNYGCCVITKFFITPYFPMKGWCWFSAHCDRQAHDEISCKECDEIFIGDNELGRHRRKVHLKGNEHICEVCGQGFKMKFYMKRHKR